jgi:phosphoketolase
MQRFEVYGHDVETVQEDAGSWYRAEDVAAHVDEMNAEIESLKAQLLYAKEQSATRLGGLASCGIKREAAEKERDTLRDVLALLAPDLKAMAILYAQQGDHTRSQALANICKSVGAL